MRRALPKAAAALLALVLLGTAAAARTIGLVYDDSGSMKDNIQLPAFGVQLLVSTLDGRDGHDRLFSIKLSQFENAFGRPLRTIQIGNLSVNAANFGLRPGDVRPDNVARIFASAQRGATLITRHDLKTPRGIETTIEEIRSKWTEAKANTPYEPIELMLDWLARETRDGERAYLVVVTDGAFYDGVPNTVPPPAVLRESYRTYKQRMKGPLEVLFLFMDSGLQVNGKSLQQFTEEDQKVHTTLLEVFGGNASENARFVRNHQELKEMLIRYVAKISGTDIDHNNSIVRRRGNAVEFDLPFSVTRIITLGTGPERVPPPRAARADFPAEALPFSPSMQHADKLSEKLLGQVTQYRIEPALGTGLRRIEFSGPVGDETVIMFRSEIGLRWKLIDPAGPEIQPDARGSLEVSRDRKYKIVVEVQDRVPGAGVVPPSRLTTATVSSTITGPLGRARSLLLTSSDQDGGFVGEVTFDAEGRHGVDTVLRLPGFVTSRADPVSVNVVARAFNIALRLQPLESCPGGKCPNNSLPVRVQIGGAPAAVAHIDVTGTPPQQRPGQFRLEVTNLDPDLQLVGPDRRPVTPDALHTLSAGQSVRFDIVRQPSWRPRPGAAEQDVTVKAAAAPPLEGEAVLAFRVQPSLPDPVLHYRGHDQDPRGTRPLVAELAGAERGAHAFDFYVENALFLPTLANLSIKPGGGVAGWLATGKAQIPQPRDQGPSGYAFSVHPRLPWWCRCFVGTVLLLGGDADVPVRVTYDPRDGRPPASAEAPLRFSIADWHIWGLWSGCTWLLIAMLLLGYLLGVILCLLRAQRFPLQARFYIYEVGYAEPRAKAVRESFWSDLLSALMLRVPRHQYRRDGLIVEADGSQLRLRTAGEEWPAYTYPKRGMSLQAIAEEIVKRKQAVRAADAIIPATWNSMVEDDFPGGRRIVFVQSPARRPETAMTRELTA